MDSAAFLGILTKYNYYNIPTTTYVSSYDNTVQKQRVFMHILPMRTKVLSIHLLKIRMTGISIIPFSNYK